MAFEDLNNVENSLHVSCSNWHDCTWETTSLLSIQLFIIVIVNALFLSHTTIILLGENTIKGARLQGRSPFPRITHDTCHFCVGL